MATAVAANAGSYAFDDRNIRWYKLGDFEHFEFAMLDVDVPQRIVDFLGKFAANQRIFLHRHLAPTTTLVLQGEHRMYEPTGKIKEVHSAGSYTSHPADDTHRDGAAAQDAVVYYSVRGKDGTLFEIFDDNLNVIMTLGIDDFISALNDQKKDSR